MVFIALNKVCHCSPRNTIMSQLCRKKEIRMTPEHFVEDILCKDPEFMHILDNHRSHGERIKNEDWTCNQKTVQIQSKDYIKLPSCELQDPGELTEIMEEEICRNYLSPHQNTHRHASDQSLGLSYHARLCAYRVLPYMSMSKDSQPKESVEEKVVSETEMHAMEMRCCLQRLRMASYLRRKSTWNNGYSNPLVCHAIHKSTDFRPQEYEIRLRYKDNSMITVKIFDKTNTECHLRIL